MVLPPPPLIGRERELQRFELLLEDAIKGEGVVWLLSGEAGTGKTRLLEQMLLLAQERYGFQVMRGACTYRGQEPYQAILGPIEALLRTSKDATARDAPSATPAADATVLPLFLSGSRQVRDEQAHASVGSAGWIGLLGSRPSEGAEPVSALASRRTLPDLPSPSQYAQEREKMFWVVREVLTQLGTDAPLVLAIDDLHWADRATLQLFLAIARIAPALRLVVIGTLRPEEMDSGPKGRHPLKETLATLRREGLVQEQEVRLLTMREVDRLASGCVGFEVSGEFVQAIHTLTLGNPFFVVEVLDTLHTQGRLDRQHLETFDPQSLRLPGTAEDLLVAQLDQLDEEQRALLQDAAVLGQEFSQELLQAMAGVGEEELVDPLEVLLERRLLEEVVGPQARLRFVRPQVREVLYGRLSRARVRLLHKKAAVALEPLWQRSRDPARREARLLRLADHAYRGMVPECAFETNRDVGDLLQARFAPAQALVAYHRALEMVQRLPVERAERQEEEAELLLRVGTTAALLNHWQEAKDALVTLLQLAQTVERTDLLLAAHLQIGEIEKARGSWAEATSAFRLALPLAEELGDGRSVAAAQRGLGYVLWRMGDNDAAQDHFQAALEVAAASGDTRAMAQTDVELGNLLAEIGLHDEAIHHYQSALVAHEQAGDIEQVCRIRHNLGVICNRRGDSAGAIEHLHAALDLAAPLGAGRAKGWVLFTLARAYILQGRLDEAAACLSDARSMLTEVEDHIGLAQTTSVEAALEAARGNSEGALDLYSQALRVIEPFSIPSLIALMLEDRGKLLGRLRRLDEARVDLQMAHDIYVNIGARPIADALLRTMASFDGEVAEGP